MSTKKPPRNTTVPSPPPSVEPPPRRPKRKGSMHDISHFDSIGARAICYHRELEQLATIVEDGLAVLRDNPDAMAVKFVADRLDEALDRVYAASQTK